MLQTIFVYKALIKILPVLATYVLQSVNFFFSIAKAHTTFLFFNLLIWCRLGHLPLSLHSKCGATVYSIVCCCTIHYIINTRPTELFMTFRSNVYRHSRHIIFFFFRKYRWLIEARFDVKIYFKCRWTFLFFLLITF